MEQQHRLMTTTAGGAGEEKENNEQDDLGSEWLQIIPEADRAKVDEQQQLAAEQLLVEGPRQRNKIQQVHNNISIVLYCIHNIVMYMYMVADGT